VPVPYLPVEPVFAQIMRQLRAVAPPLEDDQRKFSAPIEETLCRVCTARHRNVERLGLQLQAALATCVVHRVGACRGVQPKRWPSLSIARSFSSLSLLGWT
jgi:hypothetical protein